jgi:hypothetical protein
MKILAFLKKYKMALIAIALLILLIRKRKALNLRGLIGEIVGANQKWVDLKFDFNILTIE